MLLDQLICNTSLLLKVPSGYIPMTQGGPPENRVGAAGTRSHSLSESPVGRFSIDNGRRWGSFFSLRDPAIFGRATQRSGFKY